MGKLNNFFKNNSRVIFGFVIGIAVSATTVYAASCINSNSVEFTSSTGLKSKNVQDAIDEVNASASRNIKHDNYYVIAAYEYNENSGASNYCVLGTEDTCKKTYCWKIGSDACPTNTIIFYRVNRFAIIRFNVISQDGDSIYALADTSTGYTAWEYQNGTSNLTRDQYISDLKNMLLKANNTYGDWSYVFDYNIGKSWSEAFPFSGSSSSLKKFADSLYVMLPLHDDLDRIYTKNGNKYPEWLKPNDSYSNFGTYFKMADDYNDPSSHMDRISCEGFWLASTYSSTDFMPTYYWNGRVYRDATSKHCFRAKVRILRK